MLPDMNLPQAAQGGAMSMKQSMGLVLAQQLAANPTPEMAQKILAQLKASGNPETPKFEQILAQTNGDPALIKQVATAIVLKLSGGA